ncbi:MAG: hypothetical protein ACNI3C_03580 [Candidatus Marinarcus sp.]|uniref:hypothetical protein n=1 Tax=Candidatus Marinarcus sp. TaxID=3100987 RepID=UPI003AFFCA8D
MDKITYEKKLSAYKVSDASLELKQKAIHALNEQYYGATPNKMKSILSDIIESAAELKAEEYAG